MFFQSDRIFSGLISAVGSCSLMVRQVFIIFTLFIIGFSHPLLAAEDNNPYKNASNEQIKEAEAYFNYCAKDKAMSAEKDCECASAAYLDARIALGVNATKREIAKKIRYRCLKLTANTPKKLPLDTTGSGGENSKTIKEASDAQIKEAQSIFLECSENPHMSRYHDCECMAASFFDLRLEKGPIPRKDLILMELKDKCKNPVDSVGAEYTACMQDASVDNTGFERPDYCECYANRWVQLFKNHKGDLTLHANIFFKSDAQIYCNANAGILAEKKRKKEEAESGENEVQ